MRLLNYRIGGEIHVLNVHVYLVDFIFRHGFDVVLYGLLYPERQRGHVVAVIDFNADIGYYALLIEAEFDAFVLGVEKAYSVNFRNRKGDDAAHYI